MLARSEPTDTVIAEPPTIVTPPPPEPPIEEKEWTPPPRKGSNLKVRRMRVRRDGREFMQHSISAKPGRIILEVVRLTPFDGGKGATFSIMTARTRGRPRKANGAHHG